MSFYFFSLLRLSCIISISFSVINVTLFSFAHATHPFNTVLKNTLGTFTSLAQASSVNFTSGSILEAAYLTVSKLMPLLAGIGSDTGLSSFLLLFLLGNLILPLL